MKNLVTLFVLAAILQPLCVQAIKQPDGTVVYETSRETNSIHGCYEEPAGVESYVPSDGSDIDSAPQAYDCAVSTPAFSRARSL